MIDRQEYSRQYYLNHKNEINSASLRCKHRQKEKALKLIGIKCVICGTTKHLVFHEKHGINHNDNTYAAFYLKRPQDFITLCRYHHKTIHLLAELSDVDFIKALRIVELLRATN